MPRCARCGKRYKTNEKVLRHMNQPRSSCANLISDLVSISLPSSDAPQSGIDDIDMNFADADDNFATQDNSDVEMGADNADSVNADAMGSMYRDEFPHAAHEWGPGKTFMEDFDLDDFADQREANLYYPFASKEDWEIAAFLLRSGMSMALIDDFLNLRFVSMSPLRRDITFTYFMQIRELPLSFRTAKDLRGRAEMLPAGPLWKCKPWKASHPTKSPIRLFYRDPIECVESLLNSPLSADDIEFTPYRLYKTAEKSVRVYSEWLSGNAAYAMQVRIFKGPLICRVVLRNDSRKNFLQRRRYWGPFYLQTRQQ